MSIFLYILLAVVLIITAILMLRLRVRARLDSNHRLLFVGLGRSGPEMDFVKQEGVFKLFGITIKHFKMGEEEKQKEEREKREEQEGKEKPSEEAAAAKKQPKKPGRIRRLGSRRELMDFARTVISATWKYLVETVKSLIVEQFEGEIEGGFDSPHLTGEAYGYYQAIIGAVPALAGRFNYIPDWNGPSLTGSLRVSVALPLYRFAYQTLRYWLRLPLRKIIKLAIGKKKGEQDVK